MHYFLPHAKNLLMWNSTHPQSSRPRNVSMSNYPAGALDICWWRYWWPGQPVQKALGIAYGELLWAGGKWVGSPGTSAGLGQLGVSGPRSLQRQSNDGPALSALLFPRISGLKGIVKNIRNIITTCYYLYSQNSVASTPTILEDIAFGSWMRWTLNSCVQTEPKVNRSELEVKEVVSEALTSLCPGFSSTSQ